jgi:integral membrane sensor domain MASE1
MMMIIPIILWSAISMGIFGSIFIPLISRSITDSGKSENEADYESLFAMTFLGVAEIIGG